MIKELNYTLVRDDIFQEEYFNALKDERKNIKFSQCFSKKSIMIFLIIFILYNIKILSRPNSLKVIIIELVTVMAFLFINYLIKKNGIGKIFIFKKYVDYNLIIDSDKKSISGKVIIKEKEFPFNYPNIYNAFNTKSYLFIIISKQYLVIAIPKNIFNSEEELNETWNLIQECFNKAKENKEN